MPPSRGNRRVLQLLLLLAGCASNSSRAWLPSRSGERSTAGVTRVSSPSTRRYCKRDSRNSVQESSEGGPVAEAREASAQPRSTASPKEVSVGNPGERSGWASWPPASLQDVLDLYGGPRRFLIVNVPAALLALGADLFGSMRTLLSLDVMQPLVRQLRLDGVYPVRGFKRHYIDEPLSCTFSFPGDWVYDPYLERALQNRKSGRTYSSGSGRGPSTPLPLVALCPSDGPGGLQSLGLFVTSAGNATSMLQALGTLEEASASIARRYLQGAPQGAQAKPVAAAAVRAVDRTRRDAYRFELRVSNVGQEEELSVWTTAQLVEAAAGRPAYLLLLTGVAPLNAAEEDRRRVQFAVESLRQL